MENNQNKRICPLCAFFFMENGEAALSDVTPGQDFSISCEKNHWEFDAFEDSIEKYRQCILAAEDCENFDHYTNRPDRKQE